MGRLWVLRGNVFKHAVEAFGWLQTWRFWASFFDRFFDAILALFFDFILEVSWRGRFHISLISGRLDCTSNGCPFWVRNISPWLVFFLRFPWVFALFLRIWWLFWGWPFGACLKAALFKHWRCLRNQGASFWDRFFACFLTCFLESKMVVKSTWK